MGLQDTPSGERVHIGIFGRMNSGKSSIINAITSQKISIVSEVKGTTTDPVMKSMELLPLGPVVLMDTPGLDDESILGHMRVESTMRILDRTDIALVILDATEGISKEDEKIIQKIREKKVPYILVYNKTDLLEESFQVAGRENKENEIAVSASTMDNIHELKELMGRMMSINGAQKKLISDLISPKDLIILVVPVDSAAPKGRLILPQQQVIRDILDSRAQALIVQVDELEDALAMIHKKPRMVITDSQAFNEVKKIVPDDIALTSFSILMARYKGNLREAVKGAYALDSLQDHQRILISEGCSHHRQCDDIGTVKLPKWISEHTEKKLTFVHSSGTEFNRENEKYDLVVHCGGCMLNEKEMQSRISRTLIRDIPITNYGILIAHMNGILERSIHPLKEKL